MIFALGSGAVIWIYLLTTAVCLSFWPEWTACQWWYPLNRRRLDRLGYQPHTMTPTVLRVNGIFLLAALPLLAMSLLPGESGVLAKRGYLVLFVLAFAFLLVRLLAWIFLPNSVLQSHPWLTAGIAGTKYRSIFLRVLAGTGIILLAALGVLLVWSI